MLKATSGILYTPPQIKQASWFAGDLPTFHDSSIARLAGLYPNAFSFLFADQSINQPTNRLLMLLNYHSIIIWPPFNQPTNQTLDTTQLTAATRPPTLPVIQPAPSLPWTKGQANMEDDKTICRSSYLHIIDIYIYVVMNIYTYMYKFLLINNHVSIYAKFYKSIYVWTYTVYISAK